MATNRTTGIALEILTTGADPKARVTGVAVEILMSTATKGMEVHFTDESTLSASLTTGSNVDLTASFDDGSEFIANHSTIEVNLSANYSDGSVLYAASTVSYPLELRASYRDESTLSTKATIVVHDNLLVNLSDDSKLSLRPLKVTRPTFLSVGLSDESKIRVALFQGVTSPGPFYFAWADAGELPHNSSFLRDDEDIFSLTLSQSEGDFAKLTVVIKNPRIGLLAPSRKTWAWLTHYDGTTMRPLFYGRLIGLPSNIFDTRVTLEFLARPVDFAEQKENLADTMRVLPYFDPIFIQPDSWDDPDLVLDARTELWHVDRVTHELTTSDLIVPEDGVIELTEDDHLYSGLATSMGDVPVRRCRVVATIPWTQMANDDFLLNKRIVNAWPEVSDSYASDYHGKLIMSYTFDGLSSDWPKEGSSLGNAWSVLEGSLADMTVATQPIKATDYLKDWNLGDDQTQAITVPVGSYVKATKPSYGGLDVPAVTITVVPAGWGAPVLRVGYDSSRNYSEIVTVDIESDMQAIMTLPGDDEVTTLTMNTNSVSDVTRDGTTPLGDLRRSQYVSTSRGQQSVQHMILVARATLINRARAVQIDCHFKDFIRALDITLRKGLLIHDHRLPGGEASGKITKYTLSYAGGHPSAQVTINSTVGYGGSHVSNDGEDDYIDDDYIDDYYVREGVVSLVPSSDVAFTVPNYSANDDGVNFVRGLGPDNAVISLQVTGGPNAQRAAFDGYAGDNPDITVYQVILQNLYTQVHLTMQPIGPGPYATDIQVDASELVIPKQIDLEADEVIS